MLAVQSPAGRLKIAATYRISEPIENFALRVKIVQQRSPLAELFESVDETRDYTLVEERVVAWQEKIFSPRELKFYADEKNCRSDLEKEYREMIIGSGDREPTTGESRLYTRTDRDPYRPENPLLTSDCITAASSRHADAIPITKNRKPFAERYNKKVIEISSGKSLTRANRCLYKDRTYMHILVDLSPRDRLATDPIPAEFAPDSQILLCTLSHDRAAGTLTVDPDFTNDHDERHRYILQTAESYYDYWLEHASRQPNNERSKQRGHFINRVAGDERDHGYETIVREIAMPPANVLRLFVNVEIVSARGFPYEPLFVTYNLDMPRYGWTCEDRERLTGRTQRCRSLEGNVHFGYSSEIPLEFDLNCLSKSKGQQPSWPWINFIVGSIDHWTRYRIEGYSTVVLPPTSGSHSFTLATWRPIGHFVDVLRRFFTGGTSELVDPAYCGIPAETVGSSRLQKTSLKVTPAGSVRININIVRQSKIFTKNLGNDADPRSVRTCAGTLINSLDDVLEQFKAARDRMIHARAQ